MTLIRKFEESGSVADEARSGRPSVSESEEFQRVVFGLQQIDSNTPTSTRRIALPLSSNLRISLITMEA